MGTTIAKRATVEAQLAAQELERQTDNELVLMEWLREVDEELPQAIHEAKASKYADKTRENYDYWFGRLRKWMEDPTTRHRMQSKPAIPLRTLFPIGKVSETLIATWIIDEVLGPTDPDDNEEWVQTTGPWAPSTLTGVMSAVKARSRDWQATRWEPSDDMLDMLVGLRRKLAARHTTRQASPLLADQIVGMCQHLWRVESPLLARDRLIFELTDIKLTPGQIARVDLASVIAAGQHVAERSTRTSTGEKVSWTEAGKFGRRLVIAGQRRRGDKQDPPTVIDLQQHPHLEVALDRWLAARAHGGDGLLFGDVRNAVDHVRKSLTRTAELSEIAWRPARNVHLEPVDSSCVRVALDGRASWGGELIRQRDHVMLLVGWNAALRRSELVALTIADAEFDSDDVALIQIRRSKTDQLGEGAEIPIRNPHTALPEAAVVTLLRSWIDTLHSLGADDNYPLFPAFDRHGGLKRKKGATVPNAITGGQWSNRLADLATTCNVFGPGNDRRYELVSGHSLRRGFVTQAILRGVDVVQISKMTRHANVQMIAVYADKVLARQADWTSHLFGGDQLNS